jgi:uncharacterized protein YecE (DUF72 family)
MAARKKKSASTAPEAPEESTAGTSPEAPSPAPVRAGSPYLGTSGFDYDAWVGSFYPKSLKRKERLGYYSSRFGGLEVNASFYRKPTVETAQAWCAQVPETFRFVLKGWQRVTHQKRLRDCADLVSAFAAPVRALGDRMGPVLWQLPPNLKKDAKLLRDFLAILPKDLRAAFEFRHDSWNDDEIHTILAASGAALCAADTDEKPAQRPIVRTAPFGYFRLRKTEYDEAALQGWADEVRAAGFTSDVYVFFKHEDEARGPAFATAFERCLFP